MKPFLPVVPLMYVLTLCLMAAGLLTPLTDASASPLTLVGNLSEANEILPTATTASGQTTVVLDPVANTLQVVIQRLRRAQRGCPYPLLVSLCVRERGSGDGALCVSWFSLDVTSGTYASAVFDLTQATISNRLS